MKVLVTGGSGFIGSAFVRLAVNSGNSVMNIDALTYAANQQNLYSVSNMELYNFEKIDIRDGTSVEKIVNFYEPDVIVNFAAETHVDRSIINPGVFIETNLLGTYNLLEASRSLHHRRGDDGSFLFIHVSTDEVFGSLSLDKNQKFTEQSLYKPRSPYSASKAGSDHLVLSWNATYGLPTIVTNCSNNYGPFQFPEKLIPLMIVNALSERSLPIYGDGSNVRDWLHVEDHADALLMLMHNGSPGQRYCIGGNNEQTNIEIVHTICSHMDELLPRKLGLYSELIEFVDDRLGHDHRYAIDASKIKNELGWEPKKSLYAGLRETVLWYLENEHWWRPLVK